MSSFGSRCSALALMIAGCGSPAEVAVFVVLPEVELRTGLAAWNPCQLAGVDRLTLDISGAETFTLSAAGCDELEGYWGFFTADEPDGGPLVLAGLAPGYHDVVARLWDQDGTLRGRRARPFAADAPGLDLIFERGDLPGWRAIPWRFAVPSCGGAATARVTITPRAAARPAVVTEVECGVDPFVAAELPVGPAEVEVIARASDGCWRSLGELAVIDAPDPPPLTMEERAAVACPAPEPTP
jgi:hypothetical protein